MTLLLDHGLRLGELTGLAVEALDLDAALRTFYRLKVDKVQTHRLTAAALAAARCYLAGAGAGAESGLWVASDRRGRLLALPMSARAIAKRVGLLSLDVGVARLSPHDCRHYRATSVAGAGTEMFSLRDAGDWSSVTMPARYVEAGAITNERVILYVRRPPVIPRITRANILQNTSLFRDSRTLSHHGRHQSRGRQWHYLEAD